MVVRPFVVGNWKMNGLRVDLAAARAIDRVAQRLPAVEVALAPPFTLIQAMADAVKNMAVGGQDCHAQPHGAFTGDVSAAMLADAGARFVIVGHSERRAMAAFGHGEDDRLVCAKAEAALAAELAAIICVGESAATRAAGEAEAFVVGQLARSLPPAKAAAAGLSIAYEPVWAIGTGRTPAPAEVSAVHRAIRAALIGAYGEAGGTIRILYGGSVNADNALAILGADEVGGALVGGASLTADSFGAILGAAAHVVDGA